MKIEKLNEDQELFLDMLDEAEKEVGFVTDDYRIMIEALAMADGNFILTVTRLSQDKEKTASKRKKVHIKRKNTPVNPSKAIYCFNSFDEFCLFCNFLNHSIFKHTNDFVETVSLYEYKNHYYMLLNHIHMNSTLLKKFYSSITEFARFVNEPELFESKLLEYGTLIMKDRAIELCMKHFC